MTCNLRSAAATVIGFARNISKSMPDVNARSWRFASRMSPNRRRGGGLRDKNRLALHSFEYFGPQHLSVAQVSIAQAGLNAEDIRQTVSEVDPPDERLFPVPVEIGNHIYVRPFADCRSARIGAMQHQMLDAGRFQLRLIFSQPGNDCGLVHMTEPRAAWDEGWVGLPKALTAATLGLGRYPLRAKRAGNKPPAPRSPSPHRPSRTPADLVGSHCTAGFP